MRTPEEYGRIAYDHYRKTTQGVGGIAQTWNELSSPVRDGWIGDAMAVVAAVRADYAPLIAAAHTLVDDMACRDGNVAGNHERVDAAWAALDALLGDVWAVAS